MIYEISAILVLAPVLGYLLNKLYFRGGICRSKARLDDKIAIITGANTGIGYETALDFARRGAHVIMACRDLKKAEQAILEIKRQTNIQKIEVEHLDLADLDSVRSFAAIMNKKLKKLDLLVNNAGIMMCPNWRTKQGFEMQFGTNHLGHFLLTNLLLDLLKNAKSSRIINISSRAHYDFGMNWDDINWEKSYNPIKAYAQSKLCNVLFTKELAKRLEGTGVVSFSLHPGVVRTELTRNLGAGLTFLVPLILKLAGPVYAVFTKSSEEGAQTTIYCAVEEDINQYNGEYFTDCRVKTPSKQARNEEYPSRLWELSAKLVGLDEKKKN